MDIKRPYRDGASRLLRTCASERGFMLVETVIAMVIFAIVCTALVDMLTSSTSITTYAKQKTIAEEGVSNQIAFIRSLDYNSQIGLSGGNPSGVISASQAFTGVNGETLGVPATLTTDINWWSANVPGSAGTGADEKQVVVSVVRNSDNKVLATATTYIAPKYQASQTSATVQATVTDIGNNSSPTGQVLSNVRVTLTPPSGLSPPIPAGPESDTTDSSGTVIFPGLTPTSGSQNYTVGIASADLPSLYYQIPISGFGLSPTQVQPESIQVYQPVTLCIALVNAADGSAFVKPWSITVTAGSGGTSWTWSTSQTSSLPTTGCSSGVAITTQGPSSTTPLLPNIDYSIAVTANGYTGVTDDAVVPATGAYPATSAAALTNTFTEQMVKLTPPGAEMDVQVQMKTKSGTTVTCTNATVTVTAGPNSANYTSSTVSSNLYKFPYTTYPNIVSNAAPYDTTAYSVTVTTTSKPSGSAHTYTNSAAPASVTGLSGTQTIPINLGTMSTSGETGC